MNILVTGGTGTVGSQVVKELSSRSASASVSVLTRDPAKARNLPPGVTAVQGNLLDPKTVRTVFNDVEGVFLLNPVSQTESPEGLLALCGMKLSGVKHIVYLSVHRVDEAAHLPHFRIKGRHGGCTQAFWHSGDDRETEQLLPE